MHEDAVFEALAELYRLPPEEAVDAAGFVAGQIAAFMADVARLSADRPEAERARRAMADVAATYSDLLVETDAHSLAKVRALFAADRKPAAIRTPAVCRDRG
ncbi:hypothetical protein P2H44_08740 [Albimonas sp. CAU 1670]|uniref:hypothetical protein n=1 Tax=Albimonas sp. CAU 1670 TaxID=3032599 RepID=UPI0023DA2291|nr:hypothetical protein [Albimonas sp. CAU 1670]MDF2232637.1 hypothetical protein [Albimonas sp. CAU 1670]